MEDSIFRVEWLQDHFRVSYEEKDRTTGKWLMISSMYAPYSTAAAFEVVAQKVKQYVETDLQHRLDKPSQRGHE